MRQVSRRVLGALITLSLSLGGVAVATAVAAPASAANPFCNDHYLLAGNRGVPGFVSGSTVTYKCTLSQGRTGYPVKLLQESLRFCYGQNIAADGVFGPATRSALIAAQRSVGVAADGVYGPVTAKAIQHSGYSNGSGTQFCGRF
jgi:hypothetical protein